MSMQHASPVRLFMILWAVAQEGKGGPKGLEHEPAQSQGGKEGEEHLRSEVEASCWRLASRYKDQVLLIYTVYISYLYETYAIRTYIMVLSFLLNQNETRPGRSLSDKLWAPQRGPARSRRACAGTRKPPCASVSHPRARRLHAPARRRLSSKNQALKST